MLTAGLTCAPALAQQTSTATASTQAVIVKPIVLSNTSDLTFGRLASAVGTVSISADLGVRSSTEPTSLITAVGNAEAPGRASFTVTGEPGLAYDISATPKEITLSNTESGLLTVTLTGVHVLSNSKTGEPATVTSGVLDAATGKDTLGIGGSLELLGTTPSGIYANAEGIALTVNYN